VKTRNYVVKDSTTGAERLVAATSKAAALSHVARTRYSAAVATVPDAIRLLAAGVKAEVAGPLDAADATDEGASA